jgi:hypothetical protein
MDVSVKHVSSIFSFEESTKQETSVKQTALPGTFFELVY